MTRLRRSVRRLRRQLGRRGAFLTCLGALWLLYGYGLVIEPLVNTVSQRFLLHFWSIEVWGWLWIGAGCTAVVCAWLRQGWDWPGFIASYVLAVPWGLASLMSWKPYGDNPRGWIGAAVWVALGGLIATVIGWAEPPPRDGDSDAKR